MLVLKYVNINSNTAYIDFLSQIKTKNNSQKKELRNKQYNILKYAAIFIGLIGLSYLINLQLNTTPAFEKLKIEDEKITLQLQDGKTEVLDLKSNSQIVEENGQVLAVQQKGVLSYKQASNSNKLSYNTLNIPYGKRLELELSDGTIVYLNSGSSFRYPVRFLQRQNRRVFIKGEAYFKVTKDTKRAFIVNAKQINIRVVGTEFNVSSFKEDESINTVLVSGKVQLEDTKAISKKNNPLELIPGHMAAWDKEKHKFRIRKVNTNFYTAWMEGKLVFYNMSFEKISKKLERFYNVSIINSNVLLRKNTFTASFDIESIEEVLETFRLSFGIKYKIENNKIIIY